MRLRPPRHHLQQATAPGGHEFALHASLAVLYAEIFVHFAANVRHVAEVDCDVGAALLECRIEFAHFLERLVLLELEIDIAGVEASLSMMSF
jgi:hypothetical protein